MEIDILNQVYSFCIFIVTGIIIGLLFDVFRILRKSFKTSNFITNIEDIIFLILTSIILLYIIFIFNNGILRIYLFLGIGLGITFYMLTISKHCIKVSVSILLFIKRVFKGVINTLLYPFKMIFKIIKRIFFKPISFIFINISATIKTIIAKKWKKVK